MMKRIHLENVGYIIALTEKGNEIIERGEKTKEEMLKDKDNFKFVSKDMMGIE